VSGFVAIYACAAASAIILATIAVLAPRRLFVRAGAVAAASILLGSGYFGYADLLSRPKPVRLAWADRVAEDATLLGSSYQEGEAIYLWLKLPGVDEPRAYSLPWDPAQAESIEQARRDATKNGHAGTVRVRQPFGRGDGDTAERQMFYAPAQPAPPPKSDPDAAQDGSSN
jgi:hypothetical protein